MRHLRPILLILFAIGVCFVAAEPESALAHTKVHAGALALSDTAKLADAPIAPRPAPLAMGLALAVLTVGVMVSRQGAPAHARISTEPDRAARHAPIPTLAAPRGPPARR